MSAMRLSRGRPAQLVVYNQNRQQNRVRIFESGLRFCARYSGTVGIRQDSMLAGDRELLPKSTGTWQKRPLI
ncbi:hypothetical protein ACNKHN_08610 [Shigella flexneri]